MISLCMIVKNEEAVLARCLDSASGLYDELVIVDTGSDDRTVEIADGYGARILHYDWIAPGNKGEARQMGVDAATGDWVVVLDADEVLTEPVTLRQILVEMPGHIKGANLLFENYENDEPILRWFQLRAWRRGLYRYKYREHEYPFYLGDDLPVHNANVEVVVRHLPPAQRAPLKTSPMLERLKLDVEENPGDAHPLYFLHRQYSIVGDWEKSIELGQRYINMPGDHIRCEAHGNLARAHLILGHDRQALDHYHCALAENPQQRTYWLAIARYWIDRGRPDLGRIYAHSAEHLPAQAGFQWDPRVEQETEKVLEMVG